MSNGLCIASDGFLQKPAVDAQAQLRASLLSQFHLPCEGCREGKGGIKACPPECRQASCFNDSYIERSSRSSAKSPSWPCNESSAADYRIFLCIVAFVPPHPHTEHAVPAENCSSPHFPVLGCCLSCLEPRAH